MDGQYFLAEKDIENYEKDGYISLETICPPEEVVQIRQSLLGMFENKIGYEEGAQYDFVSRDDPNKPQKFPSLHDPSHYDPKLLKTRYFQRALEIAKKLLGKEAALYGEHALLKPAYFGPETPWHQDEAFRSPDFEYRELSIWLALQPVGEVNGCMQFIPGSHRLEVLKHRSPGNDRALHPLECCGEFNRADAVAAPLPAGGCTVHDMRTLHYAGANTSDTPRLAYILIFNVPPTYKPGKRYFEWLEGRRTDSQQRKQKWHRRGGLAVEVMRRLPRARLTNGKWMAWAAIRAVNKVWNRPR